MHHDTPVLVYIPSPGLGTVARVDRATVVGCADEVGREAFASLERDDADAGMRYRTSSGKVQCVGRVFGGGDRGGEGGGEEREEGEKCEDVHVWWVGKCWC